ncbi:hypothetical protein BG52_05945 [Paenibacillus darwinianus]|nr:hypothetical protein CH50_07585 [Paenibacillus darwinianus]EXX86657.1 hypothetical protein BG52_05945 [Paenibacillus darwinianus]
MKVGVQQHSFAEICVFFLERLLHLDDHLRRPGVLRGRHNPGTGVPVVPVGKSDAAPTALLHQHFMSPPDVGNDRSRGHTYAAFIVFNLLRNPDEHVIPSSMPAVNKGWLQPLQEKCSFQSNVLTTSAVCGR